MTVTQLKYRVRTASGVKKNLLMEISESMACVCVCVSEVRLLFLTLPSQGTTPQILKPKFPVHTSGPKQKRK